MATDVRAADPDERPAAALVRALEQRLRTDLTGVFAGMARAADGALEVFVVGQEVRRVHDLIDETRRSTDPSAIVRVTAGRRHSLAALETLRDRVTARSDTLRAQGIQLAGWGVDLRTNTLQIAVVDPRPEVVAALQAEFGADRVTVVARQPAVAAGNRNLSAPRQDRRREGDC